MKQYIENFCEDLNYNPVLLYIGQVDVEKLLDRLKKDMVNHLYEMEYINENGDLMYIENCDLQHIDSRRDLYRAIIKEGWSVLTLKEDRHGYYIETHIA